MTEPVEQWPLVPVSHSPTPVEEEVQDIARTLQHLRLLAAKHALVESEMREVRDLMKVLFRYGIDPGEISEAVGGRWSGTEIIRVLDVQDSLKQWMLLRQNDLYAHSSNRLVLTFTHERHQEFVYFRDVVARILKSKWSTSEFGGGS